MTFPSFCVYHEDEATRRLRTHDDTFARRRIVLERQAAAERAYEEVENKVRQ